MRYWLGMILVGGLMVSSSHALAEDLEASRVPWEGLRLKASKLFFSGTSEIGLRSVPASELALLDAGEEGAVGPRGEEVLVLSLRSDVSGRTSEQSLWMNPEDCAALERRHLRRGRKGREKIDRYLSSGVHTLRRSAAEGESPDRPADWTTEEKSYRSFAEDATGPISEPSALFYAIAASDLQAPGDALSLVVFSKSRLQRVEARVEERTDLEVAYQEISPAGKRKVRGKVDALRLVLRPQPLGDAEADDFELLGLGGDVELFLDAEKRLPLELRGKVKILDKVRVKLEEARLRH